MFIKTFNIRYNRKNISIYFFILLSFLILTTKTITATNINTEQQKEDILRALPKKDILSVMMPATMNSNSKDWDIDPNSYANTKNFVINHMKINLKTDFQKNVLSGYVIHEVNILDNSATQLVLDTRGLNIQSILWINNNKEVPLTYKLGDIHSVYGQALYIDLTNELLKESSVNIKINYETTPSCTACQWLEPSQTEGKKYPYLFTQCEAIHARSIVPCQDTPSIKQTYEAEMIVPKPMRALMSAVLINEGDAEGEYSSYKFEQKMRIPSYLLAIAVGYIKGIKIGPRSTVWSEPEMVQKAADEFVSTEDFIKIGEEYLTDYSWGVYDLLVLPPSFPYGGMENPCLTFVTPTIVAGDRSLVDVVAHEISHSWTGNLVTNSNWQHFWLNEGYTDYLERKILAKLHGEEARQLSAIIGWNDLKDSVDNYGKKQEYFTSLVPDLDNKDPDDSFSSVPYEKGFNLLYYLEKTLGGPEVFDPFIKAYVVHFTNKSLGTNEWLDFIYEYFRKNDPSKVEILDKVDWNTWLYGYGMPPYDPKFDRSLINKADELAEKWISNKNNSGFEDQFSYSDIESFNTNQRKLFLLNIQEKGPYSKDFIKTMDRVYKFSQAVNAEIRFLWQSLCLLSDDDDIFPEVVKFVSEQGRMKFVLPLYRMLFKCKNGSELAISTFKKYKSFYHPIAADGISKELGLKE